jgi:hypothetical protein
LVGQRKNGTDYFYAMTMNGWANPGKVVSWQFNSELFPDVSDANVEAAMKLRFWMKAPVARTRPVSSAA